MIWWSKFQMYMGILHFNAEGVVIYSIQAPCACVVTYMYLDWWPWCGVLCTPLYLCNFVTFWGTVFPLVPFSFHVIICLMFGNIYCIILVCTISIILEKGCFVKCTFYIFWNLTFKKEKMSWLCCNKPCICMNIWSQGKYAVHVYIIRKATVLVYWIKISQHILVLGQDFSHRQIVEKL